MRYLMSQLEKRMSAIEQINFQTSTFELETKERISDIELRLSNIEMPQKMMAV